MRQASFISRSENPRASSNCLAQLTFWFTCKVFRKAWKNELNFDDLTQPLSEHCSSKLGEELAILWSREVERARKKQERPKIYRPIIKLFRGSIVSFIAVVCFMELFLRTSVPLFLKILLKYYSNENADKLNSGQKARYTYIERMFNIYHEQGPISRGEAAFFSLGLIFFNLMSVLVIHPYMFGVMHLGMKIRIACSSLLYRKALRLKLELTSGNMVGNVINLLSNDVYRFDNGILFMPYVCATPLQIILITYYMYREVGIAAVYGMIALLWFLPIQFLLALRVLTIRYKGATETDARMKEIGEMLEAIQTIKMYTWEQVFIDIICNYRKREIFYLKQMGYIKGVLMSFVIFSFRFAIFITCISFAFHGGTVTNEKVFVVTAFLLVLRQSVTVFLPQTLSNGAELVVSFVRIEEFLLTEESEVGDPTPFKPKNKTLFSDPEIIESRIKIQDASVLLNDTTVLKNINVQMEPGVVTAVIGPVGSGKSCLLHLILGEFKQFKGEVDVKGTISYAPQEPWLFAGTIRQNILFGQKFDRRRYEEVCFVCALNTDFNLMSRGDRSMVGEKGMSLSGGQKARISLARAIYKDADIYLLDDPLSAVDTHVGQHLFEKCISGYISDKIVVLVTHQLQYLEDVEQIVLMKDGEIEAVGDYEELKGAGLDFSSLISEQLYTVDKGEKPTAEQKKQTLTKTLQDLTRKSFEMATSIDRENQKSSALVVRESRPRSKNVPFDIYKEYFQSGSNCMGITTMFGLFILTQVLASSADFLLSKWIKIEYSFGKSVFFSCYAGVIVMTVVFSLIRSFHFFNVCMSASKNLHNTMLKSVVETRMHFFNTQGSGAILNRFSRDLGAVDELLPTALLDTIQIFLTVFGIIVVLSIVNPYFMIPMILISFLFYQIRRYYMVVSDNIKRLESSTRNPVFAHVNSTLQGLATIRSSKAEQLLAKEFDRHQDMHSSAWFMFISTSRSFGYWLDCICVVYISLVTYSFLFANETGDRVGLAITQTLGIVGILQWGLRQSTEVSNQMVSVERIVEYKRLEPEPNLKSDPHLEPPSGWPISGKIEFSHAYMKYGLQDFHVLRDVSFIIQDREKVGIVGRTGAGKSSLIASLFRLAFFHGDVRIDNLDISKLCLHDLRKRISIIPQQPVLFSGTLQSNLDPFDEFDADLILKVLIDLENRDALINGKSCLKHMIIEGGVNVSAGQKQIICLARALLRNNKIIVMDEATANIDAKTDKFIQTVIKTKFAHCTVLTIAHRLHTIMDSDKVMVMDAGQVAEFDHPHILLENPAGIFTGMVERTGKHMSDNLKKISRDNYEKKNSISSEVD